MADMGKNRFVYVSSDGAGLAAYGVLKRQSEKQAAAEILAVRRDARRQGLGRAMLNHLAREAFSRLGAERLELVAEVFRLAVKLGAEAIGIASKARTSAARRWSPSGAGRRRTPERPSPAG